MPKDRNDLKILVADCGSRIILLCLQLKIKGGIILYNPHMSICFNMIKDQI